MADGIQHEIPSNHQFSFISKVLLRSSVSSRLSFRLRFCRLSRLLVGVWFAFDDGISSGAEGERAVGWALTSFFSETEVRRD